MSASIELLPNSPPSFAGEASCVDSDGVVYFRRGASQVWVSADNGSTWVERTGSNPNSTNRGFLFAIGTTVYAGNYGGYIYKTTNRGVNWTQLTAAGSRNWQAMASDGSNLYFCSQGYIYKSTDGGASVTQLTAGGSKNRIAAICVGSTLYVGVFGNYIERSTDGGNTFVQMTGSGQRQWTYNPIYHNGALYFAEYSTGGKIYRSTDGSTWTPLNPTGAFRESSSGFDGAAYFTDWGGKRVLRTYDDGTTFEVVSEPPSTGISWYTICSRSDGIFLAPFGGNTSGIYSIRLGGFSGVRPAYSGVWKTAPSVYASSEGEWKKANRIFVNASGAWKEVQ